MNNKISNSKVKSQNYNSKYQIDITSRCFQFSLKIVNMIDRQHSRYDVSGIIHNQLVRSATSIGANIVEGKASSSRREFKKYYEIALKSSNETKYWLKILLERDKTSIKDKKVINELLLEAIELSKMLGAGVRNLKNKNLVFKE